MADYRDPKVTTTRDPKTSKRSGAGKWIAIAIAVVLLLLLIGWWWGGTEEEAVVAPVDPVVEPEVEVVPVVPAEPAPPVQ